MNMVDMKLPKEKSKDPGRGVAVPSGQLEEPRYPWGLRMTLENEQLQKLPALDELTAGDEVTLCVRCRVKSVRSSEQDKGDESRSMELEVRKIGVEEGDMEAEKAAFESDENAAGEE